MKALILFMIMLFSGVFAADPQDAALGGIANNVYTNSGLGFRYSPPASLPVDQTSFARDDMQKRAAAAHRTSSTALLLRLVSGSEDTAPDWASLSVAMFSRVSWPDVDDFHAETRMNASMARGGLPVGDNKSVTFSNVVFVCTQFKMQEGSITKHASVCTTIRRGELLTFAFSGNSADNVNRIADSMKSLAFSGQN